MSVMTPAKWKMQRPGWWELVGCSYRYRAIQAGSGQWHLYVYAHDGGHEATETWPSSLAECRRRAERLEKDNA